MIHNLHIMGAEQILVAMAACSMHKRRQRAKKLPKWAKIWFTSLLPWLRTRHLATPGSHIPVPGRPQDNLIIGSVSVFILPGLTILTPRYLRLSGEYTLSALWPLAVMSVIG